MGISEYNVIVDKENAEEATMSKCQKCGCEEFVNTFRSKNALIGNCKNCNEPTLIESSPEWEAYCKQEADRKTAAKHPPVITCPYCQSTDTKKISSTSKFVSTGLFGIASSKIGKNFHCNNCKADY